MSKPVTAVEIDLLNQHAQEAERGDAAMGLLVKARLGEIAGDLTRWQWVMHGQCGEYRRAIVRWLCEKGKWANARRFALCGRGDALGLEIGGEGCRIKARGCGSRCCPRCSRKAGKRILKRVMGRLSSKPHGEMWHFVFTQRSLPGEPLADTRKRFEKAWVKTLRKMRANGMVGGLLTFHCVRTPRHAWHWHAHVLCELEGDAVSELHGKYAKFWSEARKENGAADCPLFGRKVDGPGPAMSGLAGDGQTELWTESVSEIERCLQYVVRDVLQGVEKWIREVRTSETAEEFAEAVSRCKMHRLIGEWRKMEKLATGKEEVEGSDKCAATSPAKAAPKEYEWLGTVDQQFYLAERGVGIALDAVRRLVRSSLNRGSVARRLKRAAQFAVQ